jgi:putative N6-adenine-specific DNA methylase
MPPATRFHATIVTPPGIEQLTATELEGLYLASRTADPGTVEATVTMREIYRANLHLRTASRILVPIAKFRATSFAELERRSAKVPWGTIVAAGAAVDVRVTCRKSRLYHSDAVAERILKALARAVPGVVAASAGEDDESEGRGVQLFVVRVFHDVVVISADTTGALLHRRGYRLATAKAPIRENLAAAMLLGAGWDGTRPMVDPMCGSGTLAIEAAMIARRMAPGLHRTFACERWPGAPTAAFAAERKLALSHVLAGSAVPIVASDRDAGAVEAARANARRAGVEGDIAFAQHALSAMSPPPGPGLVIVNPPYGARVGEAVALRDLYAQLGNVVRARCAGWTLAFLSADRSLERQVKLPLVEALHFKNGGIAVRLLRAEVPAGG